MHGHVSHGSHLCIMVDDFHPFASCTRELNKKAFPSSYALLDYNKEERKNEKKPLLRLYVSHSNIPKGACMVDGG